MAKYRQIWSHCDHYRVARVQFRRSEPVGGPVAVVVNNDYDCANIDDDTHRHTRARKNIDWKLCSCHFDKSLTWFLLCNLPTCKVALFLKTVHSRPLLFYVLSRHLKYNSNLTMPKFKLQTSGVRGNCSTNWAMITAQWHILYRVIVYLHKHTFIDSNLGTISRYLSWALM